jgi:hypothetical protein
VKLLCSSFVSYEALAKRPAQGRCLGSGGCEMAADVFDRVCDLCELHEALHVHEFGEDGPFPVNCQAHLEGLFGGHPHAPVQGPDGVGALGAEERRARWEKWDRKKMPRTVLTVWQTARQSDCLTDSLIG